MICQYTVSLLDKFEMDTFVSISINQSQLPSQTDKQGRSCILLRHIIFFLKNQFKLLLIKTKIPFSSSCSTKSTMSLSFTTLLVNHLNQYHPKCRQHFTIQKKKKKWKATCLKFETNLELGLQWRYFMTMKLEFYVVFELTVVSFIYR